MKKLLSILGVVAILGVAAVFAYLRWWNVFGQEKQGGPCDGRGGCRSFWCLKHEIVGGAEQTSPGYCTDKCESDKDCVQGLRCVVPSQQALDDLAKYGRPSKLCERVK